MKIAGAGGEAGVGSDSLSPPPHLMRYPYCRSADDRVRGDIFRAADAAPAGWRLKAAMRGGWFVGGQQLQNWLPGVEAC